MSNILIRSFEFAKKYFWRMLLISFVVCTTSKAGNPTVVVRDLTESFISSKDSFIYSIGFLIIPVIILSTVVNMYIRVGIYESIRSGNPPSLVKSFKNIFTLGSDMVILMLTIMLKTFLWSLLLVIPGIIKYLEYQRAIYIKFANPEISNSDCFAYARDEMDGRKASLFGWEFLYELIVVIIAIPLAFLLSLFDITNLFIKIYTLPAIAIYTIIIFVISVILSTVFVTIEPMFNYELDLLLDN